MTAPSGPPAPDLLVSGEERPPRRTLRAGQRRAAWAAVLAVALAAAAGTLVQRDRAEDARRRAAAAQQDVVRLSLLRSGQDGAPRYGLRRPGVHLVVGNAGPAPVRLLRGTVVPGGWRVEDPPDRDLRPGRSLRLRLLPPAGCGAPAPRVLRVEARSASGRPAVAAFDLAGADLAYGGTLDDAVAAAALGCDPTAASGGGRRSEDRS